MILDRLQHCALDPVTHELIAGAGLRLGADPLEPRAPEGHKLTAWLHARGRALPNLPGILHQTLAGLLQTGSSGGSTRHGLEITGLRLVDGRHRPGAGAGPWQG